MRDAREATKEVRARAAAFVLSTQLSQRARLLAAIKQDHHVINSPRQTAKHLLTPSAHQSNNVNNIKQPQTCSTSLNQASFLPNVKNIRASKLHPTETKQQKVSACLQQSSASAEEQRVPTARADIDAESKVVKTVSAEMNSGVIAEVVNGGDDMTKKSDSELSLEDMICKMENEYSKTISDIDKYAEDSEQLNNLRIENYYFKTNWQELAADLPTLKQQHYKTPTDCTSSKTMVITNRGCRRTEDADATKILFTSSKSEAMQSACHTK